MFKAAFWSSFDKVVYQALNFILAIIIAIYLGPKELGAIAIINGYVYLLNIFVDSGLTISIIRNNKITNKEISSIFIFNLSVSILFVIITLLSSSLIESFLNVKNLAYYLNLSSLILLFNSFSFVRYAKLEQNMEFKKVTFANVFSIFLSGLICWIMLYLDYGIFSVVIFGISSSLIRNLIYFFITPRFKLERFKYLDLQPHLKFGKNLLFSSSVEAIYNNGFPILITKLFTGYSAGIFFQSKRLIDGPVNLISTSSRRLFLPIASRYGNDIKETNKFLIDILKLVNYILIFMVALLFINAEYIIVSVMGEKWIESVLILKILIFGMIFYTPFFLCLDVFKITGDSSTYSKAILISRIFSIILILFSSIFGFLSLVIFFSFSQLLMFLYSVYLVNQKYEYSIKEILETVVPYIIIMVLGLVVVNFIKFGINPISVLLAKSIVFLILYIISTIFILKYNPLLSLYKQIRK
ncbi:oligosaccharide flippase family protein [uncultured Flavobacterium sp.]|uniref:oligosaccharide flippase family protein n=1 Tax=uncultured Flavobacterium sp. TaxID=165435 RepID=UPI0030C7E3AB